MKQFYILASIVLCMMCAACAPGLGNTVDIKSLSERPRKESVYFFSNPVQVYLSSVLDKRDEVFIGEINGRSLLPEGNVSLQAKTLIEKALKPHGVSINPNARYEISGSVKHWLVEIKTGFPFSDAVANSTLELEVYNKESGEKYTATYSGSASISHPFMSKTHIEETLAWALQSAIDSALADGGFLEALGVV